MYVMNDKVMFRPIKPYIQYATRKLIGDSNINFPLVNRESERVYNEMISMIFWNINESLRLNET